MNYSTLNSSKRIKLFRNLTGYALVGCILATSGCAGAHEDDEDMATPLTGHSGASQGANDSEETTFTSVEPLPQGDPLPALPNGDPAPLNPEELKKYRTGEYIEATEKHPAYNVKEPNYSTDEVTQSDISGVDAVIKYMGETYRYTAYTNKEIIGYTNKVYTDDYSYDKSNEKDERNNKNPEGQSKNNNDLREQGYWIGPYKYSIQRVGPERWSNDKKEVKVTVRHTRESYTWYTPNSVENNSRYYSWGIQEEFNLTFVYVDGKGWRVKKTDSWHSRWLT